MSAAPADWLRHGGDWPNRAASRFVAAAGLPFHVQVMGAGPPILLLHGTGAATHSWRDLAPLLASRFTVIAPDLPGHGFSGLPPSAQMSPAGVARLVAALLRVLRVAPRLVVGHSAGAAVAAQMVLDRRIAPLAMMSLNGALLPLPGSSSRLFPLAAKLLAGAPVLPWLGAGWASQPDRVAKLLAPTGSRIDAAAVAVEHAVDEKPAHARQVEHRFHDDRPRQQIRRQRPQETDHRQDADLQRVLVNDRPLWQSLRTRRPHEILSEHLQHARTHQPRDVGDVRRSEHQRGHHDARRRPPAADRQHAQVQRKNQHAQRPRHERRHADGQQRREHRPRIEHAVVPHRREHAQPNPGGRGDEERQGSQRQRNGHRLGEDFVGRAVAVLDGQPQVAVEQVAQVIGVLLEKRPGVAQPLLPHCSQTELFPEGVSGSAALRTFEVILEPQFALDGGGDLAVPVERTARREPDHAKRDRDHAKQHQHERSEPS